MRTQTNKPDSSGADADAPPFQNRASRRYHAGMRNSGRIWAATATLGLALGCSSSSTPKGGTGSPADSGAAGASTASGGASNASGGAGVSGGTSTAGGSSTVTTSGPTTASAMAQKLGRPANFLIGLGNDLNLNSDHDLDGAFTLGTTLDLHYAYLSAYKNMDGSWGSWVSWNANGTFVDVIADSAD